MSPERFNHFLSIVGHFEKGTSRAARWELKCLVGLFWVVSGRFGPSLIFPYSLLCRFLSSLGRFGSSG